MEKGAKTAVKRAMATERLDSFLSLGQVGSIDNRGGAESEDLGLAVCLDLPWSPVKVPW